MGVQGGGGSPVSASTVALGALSCAPPALPDQDRITATTVRSRVNVHRSTRLQLVGLARLAQVDESGAELLRLQAHSVGKRTRLDAGRLAAARAERMHVLAGAAAGETVLCHSFNRVLLLACW